MNELNNEIIQQIIALSDSESLKIANLTLITKEKHSIKILVNNRREDMNEERKYRLLLKSRQTRQIKE